MANSEPASALASVSWIFAIAQHVDRTRRPRVSLGVGKGTRLDQVQARQPHRLHRPGGGADVPRMARAAENDVDA
jgi:hypothetical protein